METLTEKTIGQFVAGNYKTAAVFKKYKIDSLQFAQSNIYYASNYVNYKTAAVFKKHKIDFCCNGNRTLSQACEQQKLDQEAIEVELHSVLTQSAQQDETINYKFWPLDLLVDYVEKKHHRYVKAQIPVKNPIEMMMHEHDTEGSRFRKISELTDTYTPPADACGTYKVAFALLKEFEEDLQLHIHIENTYITCH